jgi:[acyl-carrier-protein] S-malonyltransferase
MIELVPGGTLTGIARRAMKGVETFAIKSAADLDGAREFAAAHA